MSRKALLVVMLAMSVGLFGQKSGGSGTTGSGSSGSGASGAGTSGSGTTAGSGINTSASQAGSPTTQGAVGGLSGQAASGPVTTPSANTAGTPTLPSAMAGPAGTTGSTQANPDNLNNGATVNNGFVGTGVGGSGVLSTPGGTFASPAPTAGISDAGRAGISANTPMNTGVRSTLENSTIVYTNGAPVNPGSVNIGTAASTPGRLINDMGPSFYSDTIGGSGRASLGEIAAQYKAAKGSVNARTLTNEDIQKMVSDKTGVTMAKNMPPVRPDAIPQGGASPQTSAEQAGATQAQTGTQAAQINPSAAPPAQPAAAENQGQAAGQAGGEESSAGAATTPQINRNQQSNDAQGRSKLPATSTLLPLLGLLGVVSGGLGLWFRRFRK